MASSKAKTGRQRLRMRQKENSRFEPFQLDLEEGIPEKQQKNEKTSLWILFKPKQEGQAKNEREKNILVPIHSNSTRNREFQKNSKKIQKIKKHHYGFFPTQNRTGEAENMKKKNSRSDPFQPDLEQGIPKKQQKISKN